ncbi:MAG: U32 family peptidase, partial [Acutalibacteraceae bacterium]|nr:U32 family peptidase [Acutalibacteraceae bacterium]
MDKTCEILAPVGSWEMLVAAVRSGANAVYLGAKEFSARRNAENFRLADLKNAIEYCHIRGVKVYLTLNILIKEKELTSAFELAKNAYNLGIDGIIIEDLGLAKILREKIPDLKLHASTQMSVHSVSALPILKEMGFVRVVVAREISKKDLISLCEKAKELGMEVEVFVHGALCMCLSGQCQLSAFLGQRSGNRGLCAGPCRLPFKAKNGTGYDLSLKDLSLLDHIRELREIGVKSFKIEGRMKRPEYVACAVFCAKQSLEKGYIDQSLAETLKNVFSRQGFTDGYYTDNLGRDMFGIRTKEDVISADKAFPLLHELYRGEMQSVPISVKAKIRENTPMELCLLDGKNTVTVLGDKPQKAKTKALEYDEVLSSLTKFGGTPYYDEGGGVDLDDGLFVSRGSLNELRRKAIEELNIKRAESKILPCTVEYSIKDYEKKTKTHSLICRFVDKNQIPDDLSGISAVIYPLEKDPDFSVTAEKIVDIPRGIINEDLISKRLKLFKEKGFKTALCGNLASVQIAMQEGFNII